MINNTDFLCESFLSNELQKKRKKSEIKSCNSSHGNKIALLRNYDYIDFILYNKDPMKILKLKYEIFKSSNKIDCISFIKNINQAIDVPHNYNKPNYLQKLLIWKNINQIGAGLLNMGNNCFLNATLQCLAYTPPFCQWLLEREHTTMCSLQKVKKFCSMCEIENLIGGIFSSKSLVIKPSSLCINIKSWYHIIMLFLFINFNLVLIQNRNFKFVRSRNTRGRI
jgi:hypothetical protein